MELGKAQRLYQLYEEIDIRERQVEELRNEVPAVPEADGYELKEKFEALQRRVLAFIPPASASNLLAAPKLKFAANQEQVLWLELKTYIPRETDNLYSAEIAAGWTAQLKTEGKAGQPAHRDMTIGSEVVKLNHLTSGDNRMVEKSAVSLVELEKSVLAYETEARRLTPEAAAEMGFSPAFIDYLRQNPPAA